MSEWTGGEHVNLGPSGAIAAADYALSRFKELGAKLPPDNRLVRAQRLLVRVNSGAVILTDGDQELLRKVTEAQWSILDFYLIAKATGNRLSKEYIDKIALALGGTDLPEHDKNHLPRNTEFELFTAAMLTMGDIPVTLGEPDVIAEIDGRFIGIAAKRVQGTGAIRRRMTEAGDQIERAGMPGVIAVNTDVILIGTTPVGDANSKGQTVDEQLAAVHQADDELILNPNIVGRIAFGRAAQWTFEDERPMLTQDMFRQYRVYERSEGEGAGVLAEWSRAEELIAERMQQL